MEFEVDIWIENTLTPFVVWRRDLPFTWSTAKKGNLPEVVIEPEILERAIEGKVRSPGFGL